MNHVEVILREEDNTTVCVLEAVNYTRKHGDDNIIGMFKLFPSDIEKIDTFKTYRIIMIIEGKVGGRRKKTITTLNEVGIVGVIGLVYQFDARMGKVDKEDTMEGRGFDWVLQELKKDNLSRYCRRGWNGKDMWISLHVARLDECMSRSYIYMKTADGEYVPWVASQTDLLAEDWIGVTLVESL